MRRIVLVVRRYGLDVLIVVAAVESAIELVVRRDVFDAPRTTLWFLIPASWIVILPLLGRRRYPFAAPAAVWVSAGA